MNEITTHTFTESGMGPAPFTFAGFYEMPDLGEQSASTFGNPDGLYADAPRLKSGLGTCCHCGHAIQNIYIVRNGIGELYGVGCDCIEKAGDAGLILKVKLEKRKAARAKREAKWMAKREAYLVSPEFAEHKTQQAAAESNRVADHLAKKDSLRARLGVAYDTICQEADRGVAHGNGFIQSLRQQLEYHGSLSERQSEFAAKAILGRRVKANAAEFDTLCEKLEGRE